MIFMEDQKSALVKLARKKKRDDAIIFFLAGVMLLSVMFVF